MVTQVSGVRVGHWTDHDARTGCTVVHFPEGTVASGEVRGGAPATREFALLEPHRTIERIDAVVLSGGSAFGLSAADGVMRYCEQHGRGHPTAAGPVPIVVGLGLFDLLVGDPSVRPGPDEGYAACIDAERSDGPVLVGAVGAGAGCTVGKWRGRDHARPAGLGAAAVSHDNLVVAALVAVNAFGDVDEGLDLDPGLIADGIEAAFDPDGATATDGSATDGNTTIGVVVTNARLDKLGCHIVAQGAHSGLSRALVPSHTRVDGDAMVAAATGEVHAHVDVVRHLALSVVERAVRAAVAGG